MKTLRPGGLAYRLTYAVVFVGQVLVRIANAITGYHPLPKDSHEKTDR